MSDQVPMEDVHKAVELLKDVQKKATSVSTHIQGILEKVHKGELVTAKGVSFLEVKNQMLLSYLTNLSCLMCHKASGKSIQENPTIDRLVEIRTVLEKMRPIDQKLKYQIDKLIRTATTGIGENDPLRFKPNPDNLASKLDDESSGSGSESGDEKTSTKKYQPPKLAAVHYDVETEAEKEEKLKAKAVKRSLSSGIIEELRKEYYDGPEEVKDSIDIHRMKEDRKAKAREEYEEDRFVRIVLSKKEKAKQRQVMTMSGLNHLTNFGSISALTGEHSDEEGAGRKRKRSTPKSKGKKKGGKKKRFK